MSKGSVLNRTNDPKTAQKRPLLENYKEEKI